MEEWRISNFANSSYAFSSLGRVKNLHRNCITKGVPNSRGYLRICNTRTKTRIFIHREVARLFLGECPKGMVVNHKDGNPVNNEVNNLEYVSQRDNIIHSIIKSGKKRKFTQDIEKEICKKFKEGKRQFELAKEYNCHRDTIMRILKIHGLKENKDNQQLSHNKYNYEKFNDQ